MVSSRALSVWTLAACLGLVALPAPAAAVDEVSHDDDDMVGDEAFVMFSVEHDGQRAKHPGYLGITGEEMILTMSKGDRTFEVSIFLERTDGGGWKATIKYSVDGRQVLSESKSIKPKKWLLLTSGDGKSKLSIQVDPDRRRADEIQGGGGDNDPLGGLEK